MAPSVTTATRDSSTSAARGVSRVSATHTPPTATRNPVRARHTTSLPLEHRVVGILRENNRHPGESNRAESAEVRVK